MFGIVTTFVHLPVGRVIEILRYLRLKFGEPSSPRAGSSHLLSNS